MFRFRDGRQGAWVSRVPAPLAALGLMLLLLLTVGTLAAQESGAVEASPTAEGIPVEGAPAGGDAAQIDPAAADALFTKRVLATNVKQVHDVVAADFDGAGDNDFAATYYVKHQLVYFPNNGN